MNFLSHFYFDRHSEDPHLILGTVLPDLIRNARNEWKLHPEKNAELFSIPSYENSMLRGWMRHLEVDRYFHNSDFFNYHTAQIKKAIVPALKNSVVRPSFLAHISLELFLDSLLLTEGHIQTDNFYNHLRQSDRIAIKRFLEINQIDDTAHFYKFFDRFMESKYLESYRETGHILYALNRICMRLWKNPMSEDELKELKEVLSNYRDEFMGDYMDIYEYIGKKLKASKT